MIDPEQIAQEDALWPWLADDSMGDTCEDRYQDDVDLFFETHGEPAIAFYCHGCGAGFADEDWELDECPDCGCAWH